MAAVEDDSTINAKISKIVSDIKTLNKLKNVHYGLSREEQRFINDASSTHTKHRKHADHDSYSKNKVAGPAPLSLKDLNSAANKKT